MKKTVIITGGTKGLGHELSLAFAQADWTVLALYSSDESAAQKLGAEFANLKARGLAVRHDVRSGDQALWNRPEIQEANELTLIHNACAAFTPLPMHQLGWGDFENNLSVLVQGAWACTQPLLRLMVKNKRGAIVNVLTSAIHGIPPKGFAAYTVAKHALRGMTLALAGEYSRRGVKVFSVSPGYMDTALTQQWDSRFREVARTNSRNTDPVVAAKRVFELVLGEAPGTGEDYTV